MKIAKKFQPLLILLVFIIIIEGSLNGLLLLSTSSYTTGYEGAKASFAGVQYAGEDDTGMIWGSTLSWDPDAIGTGKPGISGEMTSVFVPQESVGFQPSWIEPEWLLSASQIKNPIKTYEWELPVEDTGQTAFYRMEEWKLKWYFSISCEPSGSEIPSFGSIPDPTRLVKRNYLQDVKVWFEFDLTPTWYFEGADHAYFAIAEARISDIAKGGKLHLKSGQTEADEKVNDKFRVTPSSTSSILTLYYGLFGSSANRADKEPYEFQGKKLNPDLFTDRVFTYFTLDDVGVTAWWDVGTFWRADVVTVGVDIHVFVIGEWLVQDVQDVPDEYGRTAKEGGVGLGLGAFLSTPMGRLMLVLIGALIIFLILAIFAPWALIALSSIFGGRRRR